MDGQVVDKQLKDPLYVFRANDFCYFSSCYLFKLHFCKQNFKKMFDVAFV